MYGEVKEMPLSLIKRFFQNVVDKDWLSNFFNPGEEETEKPSRFKEFPELVEKKCELSRNCVEACPVSAIEIIDDKPMFDKSRCIRCGDCRDSCPNSAILAVNHEMKFVKGL